MTEERPIYIDGLGEIEGHKNLWCAVLANVVAEALGNVVGGVSAPTRNRIICEARDYITIPNRHFNEVCSLAGLDPEAVRDRVTRQLADTPSPEIPVAPKRGIMRHTFDGKTLTLSEWASYTGIREMTLRRRIRMGWPIERALTEPARLGRKKTITTSDEATP